MVTHFQARARGYLLRDEVRRARDDFEDIVKEIDGGLDSLKWVKKALYFPHFTDTQDAIFPFSSRASNSEISKSEGRDCSDISTTADSGLNREDDGGDGGLLEKLEAERDVSENIALASVPQNFFHNCIEKVHTDAQNKGDVPDREVMDSACDSTTVWSSADTDMDSCHSIKGLRQYCLAQDVQQTPEALRVHRNTLSMELLWLQQAIDSRKKYLSLKNKLSGS